MTEKVAHIVDVHARLDEVRGLAVPQQMGLDRIVLRDARMLGDEAPPMPFDDIGHAGSREP